MFLPGQWDSQCQDVHVLPSLVVDHREEAEMVLNRHRCHQHLGVCVKYFHQWLNRLAHFHVHVQNLEYRPNWYSCPSSCHASFRHVAMRVNFPTQPLRCESPLDFHGTVTICTLASISLAYFPNVFFMKISIDGFMFNFFKAFVRTQSVSYATLPIVWWCLKVWKMLRNEPERDFFNAKAIKHMFENDGFGYSNTVAVFSVLTLVV